MLCWVANKLFKGDKLGHNNELAAAVDSRIVFCKPLEYHKRRNVGNGKVCCAESLEPVSDINIFFIRMQKKKLLYAPIG